MNYGLFLWRAGRPALFIQYDKEKPVTVAKNSYRLTKPMKICAHTLEGLPESEWQSLEEHLTAVAELACSFGASFEAAGWGRIAGLWHDLGKYRPAFQRYLRGGSGAEHAIVGALLSRQKGGSERTALPLEFVIAGHHAGLANRASGSSPQPLESRIKGGSGLLEETLPQVPELFREIALPELPSRFLTATAGRAEAERTCRNLELWIRFLYSALVDADFLDTEEFYKPGDREIELAQRDSIATLRTRLDAAMDDLESAVIPSVVNSARSEILQACRQAADWTPGLFSLTVPTGGGKTLASMSFALRHAERHGLKRVIAVVPFTSIIEQNAAEYRKRLGEANVLEHHSNLDPEKETRRNKLASENWDAPVVVTTAVQFFESLFANRSSRCRKLHNVASSVILLDEVQTLPIGFQLPILEVLQELAAHYRCSIVFSTATQPAFQRRDDFSHGLVGMREIAPDPRSLARLLRRFEITWSDLAGEPVLWTELAEELRGLDHVLAVVHRRADAQELARLLPQEGRFHLSALMCAAHRLTKIRQIRRALKEGRRCRLVSTQLIEAGVDVDFPVVYRALGGLDSIIQAGGRANREGRLEMGRVIVFLAPSDPPPGTPQKGLETTRTLLARFGSQLDATDPDVITTYFRLLFGKEDGDVKHIQRERAQLNFATVAREFQMIADGYSRPIVVPYGDAVERLDRLREKGPSRDRLRALQPFLVNIPKWQLEKLLVAGAVDAVQDVVYGLNPGFEHLYDEEDFGLMIEESSSPKPEALIV